MKAYPTAYVIFDEHGEKVGTVEAFDEDCSTVNIYMTFMPETWLELSAEVHKCLLAIHARDEQERIK